VPVYDVHLRSASAVRGYHVQGSDAGVGHIDDFLVDDVSWALRYLVLDTSNWWFGKKLLIDPKWVHAFSWEERSLSLDLTRAQIQKSPPWQHRLPLDRAYELQLYEAFGRPADSAPRER
jgi:hypothetical protein